MLNKKDNSSLIGKRFTRLEVVKQVDKPDGVSTQGRHWLCVCDCGKEIVTSTGELRRGRKKSCNCLMSDRSVKLRGVNIATENGDIVEIRDSKGRKFTVDKTIYERKIKNSDKYWFVVNMHGINYVASTYYKKNIYLHRYILEPEDDYIVDHIDGEGTNNLLSNLRVVKQKENTWNRATPSNNTSGVKGVSWVSRSGKWISRITHNGKRITLGTFENFQDAVLARVEAEKELYGEYSRLNSDKTSEGDVNYE